ncbi:MAG: Gluconeogenesis factor [Proteobacteria bacterium]|nr:MAG: Gluconeogenesis factor [Pseudomonadota bacterium]
MIKKPNVVVIGGGTGLSNLLRGLKHFPVNLSAIVTVADDGGSTGKLRKDYDIPAPGDLRNVMVSLSKKESLIEEMFQYRFKDGELKDQCLGNIMLAGMVDITGSMTQATKALSDMLDLYGEVIPVSNQPLELCAKLTNGKIIKGESNIAKYVHENDAKIDRVFYEDDASATRRAMKAIKNADFIIFGIGSLYTSIAPNLVIDGIKKELLYSKAEKIYICNAMQQPGETTGYTVYDHVRVVEKHLEGNLNTIIVNSNMKIPKETLKMYHDDGADIVEIDYDNLTEYTLIEKDLIKIDDDTKWVRHNFLKLGVEIYSHILEKSQ